MCMMMIVTYVNQLSLFLTRLAIIIAFKYTNRCSVSLDFSSRREKTLFFLARWRKLSNFVLLTNSIFSFFNFMCHGLQQQRTREKKSQTTMVLSSQLTAATAVVVVVVDVFTASAAVVVVVRISATEFYTIYQQQSFISISIRDRLQCKLFAHSRLVHLYILYVYICLSILIFLRSQLGGDLIITTACIHLFFVHATSSRI